MDFKTLLKRSDVLSVHCPLNSQTKGMLSASALADCKPGALLINLARGGIVEEEAVCEAWADGKLAGYGMDVAKSEPIAPDNLLLKAPNCVVTPHAAWGAQETRRWLLKEVVDNLSASLEGRPKNVADDFEG